MDLWEILTHIMIFFLGKYNFLIQVKILGGAEKKFN